MEEWFSRTQRVLGEEAVRRLAASRVAVFGVGGVGGHCAEAMVRSGIGEIDLIDSDRVAPSNLNRQIIATLDTVGMPKVEAARQRFLSINPELRVNAWEMLYLPETADRMDFSRYDYVVDAVDTVAAKVEIIVRARACGVPVISCMGAGNKTDGSRFEVADLAATSVCPLARAMRRELRKRGIEHVPVVYSREEPVFRQQEEGNVPLKGKGPAPGSLAFVPAVAGLLMAGEVVLTLAGFRDAPSPKDA